MGSGRFVGIDVAKRRLDVAERPGDERWDTTNDVAGISGLVERLKAGGALRLIVLEATGGYEIAVVAALAAAGLPVVVINARQVRAFARAVGKLAKTDAIDATVLAHFAEGGRKFRWEFYDPACAGQIGYASYRFSFESTRAEAKGARVVFDGIGRFDLEGDRIKRYSEVFDRGMALAQQAFEPERLVKIELKYAKALRARPEWGAHAN